MLCLTRKAREKVILTTAAGEEIEICVLEIEEWKVRLGFSAPLSVKIMRDEIKNTSKSGD